MQSQKPFLPLPQLCNRWLNRRQVVAPLKLAWTTGICPQCGSTKAEVDPNGVLWCLACGYSKKGVFT